MKTLIRIIIFGGVFFLLAYTNPEREAHQIAITKRLHQQAQNDPLRQAENALHNLQEKIGISPFTYHDYQFLSVMKNEDGQNITLGIAKRIFIFQDPTP